MLNNLLQQISEGNARALARGISMIENETTGYDELLRNLASSSIPVIGITGPPGAGKSTLTDALINQLVLQNKKVAVLCVDPSSPFKSGAILGDRIRMSDWYNHPAVYIRSLASRGTLGGLHPKIIEITDLVKSAPFDYIIIETVGVGQSEVEIAGLADITVVVLVPESGDEIQVMKAGLMEVADIFVVNKADRPDAAAFVHNLRAMLPHNSNEAAHDIPIIKTIATQKKGIEELLQKITDFQSSSLLNEKKMFMLAEKAYSLIQKKRMRDVNKHQLAELLKTNYAKNHFNLYGFADSFPDITT
ncbi:MAG: methylmalonyl Co-A mutase-associated GTPase MeaB [Chitinophagaceae bacterium]